jgi:hypothetical protein
MRKAVLIALGAAALTLGSVAPASGADIVEKKRGEFVCSIDPGDVPGLPGIAVENATVIIVELPNGGLIFHCSGALPSDIAVPTTLEGYLPCFASETAMVPAHYAIRKGGRIQYTCVFPAASV